MTSGLRVMVSTPRGLNDPALAIAGSRAGAVGILDLGALADLDGARRAVAELLRLGRTTVGLRVEANGDPSAVAELVAALPPGAGWLVLAPEVGGAFAAAPRAAIASARERGLNFLAEVGSRQDAEAALELGVNGLIAKGSEAGGRVDDETTFVLLQELLQHFDLPVWARGGIGTHTAAACAAAGAVGVVVGDELALVRESTLPAEVRQAVAGMDGSETTVVGAELGQGFRFVARPGCAGSETLRRRYVELLAAGDRAGWSSFLNQAAVTADGLIGWGSHQAWPLGQDASFAASLAARFRTTGGVVAGLLAAVEDHLRIACSDRALAPGSALAVAHGTRYPIVQGPMTRVSDVAPFALEVAKAGALPFIALALMRAPEVRTLLVETQRLLGESPWGVGILGFVPRELREEQLAVVREVHPRFVLIAGGRPDQAAALEAEGIASYLHVPSPRLLDLFIDQGARRFVFEGRECGGHVGPRSSFVLWQQMVDVLCARTNGRALDEVHVLFAGGIHDARSAAMVAALAAPLAASGARVGVLMGTAYLFTAEAVSSSAIVPGFQEVAVACTRTTVLETGPGHSTRCAPTPFAEAFATEKSRLLEEGRSGDEIRLALEAMNLGKLRVAAKGVDRNPKHQVDAAAPKLQAVDPEQQTQEGMYMIGQVAALRDRVTTMADLHEAVSERAMEWLSGVQRAEASAVEPAGPPLEIAIVGMACLLPGATDLATFWDNVVAGTDVTTEVPRERWEWQRYFDEDRTARDKVYSRWGGFLPEIPFDPLAYGMPPSTLRSIEPLQLLTLEVVRAALADAGLLDREFPRQRASVILGAGGGVADLGNRYAVRATLPSILDNLPDAVWDRLPEWTEDSFAGLLLNVAAGRAANRFDLGGINLTVDAACASSLAAVYLAAQELADQRSDIVLVGGVDTAQNPFGYLCFSKTHALSPRGKASVFDASADGIVISEGLAVIVLKRLADAERDGDRIYAVLRGVGGSSDGRGRSMTAPRPAGQVRALERAYRQASYSPATVALFEAHGTGTAAGDLAEAETLRRVLEAAGAPPASAAVGSVKSMIGHTKCTAGVTGVIKSALALHRKVLPPTINVERPNPKAGFGDGPLYVNSELRPWLAGVAGHPRRAGVSAFGFGGTNFHVTLEEYTGDPRTLPQPALAQAWPGELLLFRGERNQVVARLDRLAVDLGAGARPRLRDLAYSCWCAARHSFGPLTAALLATGLDDLPGRLARLRDAVVKGADSQDPGGAWYASEPLAAEGEVAFLFPGQGSQYPDMLRELCLHFRLVREEVERAESALAGVLEQPLGRAIYPPPAFTSEERQQREATLRDTRVAQPALGAVEMGACQLLSSLGVRPAMLAGHSYGELAALAAAGVLGAEDLARLSEARGRWIVEEAARDLGTMAAVRADEETTADALAGLDEVWIANLNAPVQTVISGTRTGIARAVEVLRGRGIEAKEIPVACAFHSPVVVPAADRLARGLEEFRLSAPTMPVYSNATAAPYSSDPAELRSLLAAHLISPVRFADEVDAMYEAGARIFVEVGPRTVLSGLVRQILDGRRHLALALDQPGRHGLVQLLHVLGALAAQGVGVDLDPLFAGRGARLLDLDRLAEESREPALPPSTWMVNGGGVRPVGEALTATVPLRLESAAPCPAPERAIGRSTMPQTTPEATRLPAGGTAREPVRGAPPAGAEQVIAEFQRSMTHLIESQERVMLAYLGAAPEAAAARPVELATGEAVAGAEVLLVAAAAERPTPAAAVEDLPVPSPRDEAVVPVQVGEPAVAGPPDRAEILARLIGIVADRTGYPAELVDAGASLEADLGIDSIKRVEILGELQRALPAGLERQLQEVMEELSSAPSLGEIADRVAGALAAVARPAAVASAAGSETGPPPPRALAPQPPDAAEVLARLIGIVADRTGYPAELVDAGASLEADLGIDSIKRVEILGELQRALPAGLEQQLQEVMEELSSAPSLADIARRVAAALAAGGARSADPELTAAAPAPASATAEQGVVGDLPRFTMEAVAIAEPVEGTLSAGTILITEDGRGVGEALAASLRLRGVEARTIECGGLAPESAFAALDAKLAAVGDLTGVVFLPPMTPARTLTELSFDEWRQLLRRETGCLFRFVQQVVPALAARASGGGGRPRLLAATTLGGHFALGPRAAGEVFPPGHGGICGLMKTLAVEHPELSVKVVDLDARESADEMAGHLLRELSADDGEVEVGWRQGQRWAPRPVAAPAAPDETPYLDAESVVLLTGGARGITAEIAVELAERFRPTLILVGRSPEPGGESEATAGISEPRQLKAALIEQRRRSGLSTQLPEVEADYRQVVAEREMRETFERLEAAGARWEYFAADVRVPEDMARVLGEVRARHRRLDAVLHGAGSIEDKLLLDKQWDSFERVFETKALSTFLLTRELASFFDTLRFVGLFSSVAGTFPNRGQADYTAANEVVNKMAVALADGWAPPTCRVVAMAWGPWEKGMASDSVQARFRARGVEPIAVPDGRRALLRELAASASLPVVVLGRGPWEGVAIAGAVPAAGGHQQAKDTRPRIG